MRRVRVEGGTKFKDAKRKTNRATMADEEPARGPKPGLETTHPHIAQMFLKGQSDLAIELSRSLRPHLAARLGVRRRPSGKLR